MKTAAAQTAEVIQMSLSIGYLLLRKPEWNFDLLKRKTLRRTAPHIKQVYYAGVDRMAWFDFDELHYHSTLTASEEELWKYIKAQQLPAPLGELRAIGNLEAVRSAMSVLKTEASRNDICQVRIIEFEKWTKEELPQDQEWLGMDIVVSGYGSTLVQGIYARPDLYASFVDHLNNNGLFPANMQILADYKEALGKYNSAENNLEIFPEIRGSWYLVSVAPL